MRLELWKKIGAGVAIVYVAGTAWTAIAGIPAVHRFARDRAATDYSNLALDRPELVTSAEPEVRFLVSFPIAPGVVVCRYDENLSRRVGSRWTGVYFSLGRGVRTLRERSLGSSGRP
ncbi:MAG: hypothetical protein JO317_07220 [Verrucomicrobiae bacterium]|nr:hypothetical protein [Verrucomicrobiae bacterium]